MATFIGGTAMVLQFIDASGTISIQNQYTKFTVPWKVDKVDTSSGSVTSKTYLPTLKDATADYEGFNNGAASPLGTADLKRMEPGKAGTLIWAPFGTNSGSPKGGGYGFWETGDVDYPFANAVTVKLAFQFSGDLTYDPNSSTF